MFARPDNGKKANGLVLWQGPSSVDGAEIVAIAVGLASGSTNRKTGDMVQTYILRADLPPTEAARQGLDVSVCGGCKHRPSTGGACYVVLCQGPLAVWKSWKAGKYATASGPQDWKLAGAGRNVRLGSYGDPVAVPVAVWQGLTSEATGWTGYTHQWTRKIAGEYRDLCQASVDTVAEYHKARRADWGTFRVTLPQAEKLAGEKGCPAAAENGAKVDCATCQGCSGMARKHWSIEAHGGKAARAKVD